MENFIYVECDIPEGMTIREWRKETKPRQHKSIIRRLLGI